MKLRRRQADRDWEAWLASKEEYMITRAQFDIVVEERNALRLQLEQALAIIQGALQINRGATETEQLRKEYEALLGETK